MTKFTVRKFNKESRTLRERITGKINIGHTRLSVLLLGVITFSSLFYLFYMNQTATGGFDIKGLEITIEELDKENKSLNLEVAELQSLTVIEEASAEMGLVATSYIEYLPAVGSTVAQR